MFVWFDVLGFAGSTLGAVMVLPQVLRAVRSAQLSAISLNTWTMVAVSSSAWVLYGVWREQWPQLMGLVTLAGAVVILIVVSARVGTSAAPRILTVVAACVASIVLNVVAGPAVTGIAASAVGVFAALPPLVSSVRGSRARASRTACGSSVSSTTWAIYAVSQVFWLSFGIFERDPIVIGYAAIVLALAAGIVTAERRAASAPARSDALRRSRLRVPPAHVLAASRPSSHRRAVGAASRQPVHHAP